MSDDRTEFRLTLGEDANHRFDLGEGDIISVGRDPANTIRLTHRSIAPFHCDFQCRDGMLRLLPKGEAWLAVETRMVRGPVVLGGNERIRVGALEIVVSRRGGLGSGFPESKRRSGGGQSSRWTRRRLREEVTGKGPGYAVSVLFHVVLVWLLLMLPFRSEKSIESTAIMVDVTPEVTKRELFDVPDERETLEEVEPPELPPVPDVEDTELAIDDEPLSPLQESIEPWRIGLGTGRVSRSRLAVGEGRPPMIGQPSPFLSDLRGRGLDVALVIDVTVSMEGALSRVKASMNRMIRTLVTSVPDLRVGFVAYADHDEPVPVRVLDLGDERYRILNFIEDLEARGGGDFEEALGLGLSKAVRSLSWRPVARRVIITMGDALPHRETRPEIEKLIQEHVSGEGDFRGEGLLSTVVVETEDRFHRRHRDEIVRYYADLARRGRGESLVLGDMGLGSRRLCVLVFGAEHGLDLANGLENGGRGGQRNRIIRRKIRAGDGRWLLRKLRRTPVHPGVVEGLIQIADRALLRELVVELGRGRMPVESRFASVYILKRCLPTKVSIDPNRPMNVQRDEFDQVLRALLRSETEDAFRATVPADR